MKTIAKVINNNQPGWTNIIETEPHVTLDVGTELFTKDPDEYLTELEAVSNENVSESTETAGYAEIHADAREASARQTFKAMTNTDRPDIAVAILLRAIDEWYEKGVAHGKSRCREHTL